MVSVRVNHAAKGSSSSHRVLEQRGLLLEIHVLFSAAGTAEEMVCPGGEAAFVGAMVADSLMLRGRVHW